MRDLPLHSPSQPVELRAMKRRMGLGLGGLLLAVCAAVFAVAAAMQPAGAACQSVEAMIENFMSVYPTGSHAARFGGAPGEKIMRGLAIEGDGDEVVFLYSGDGPTTGARGRYMYMILDSADCILHSDWVDGDAFDRVVPAE